MDDVVPGEGEMARRIRDFDWASTPLGPAETWSPVLRMMLRVLLANRFPTVLWWGPHYIQFYNDAYRPIPGTKHPEMSFGRPAAESWPEIWHILEPLIDTPFHGGPATWNEDILLEIDRHGFLEETHFTISYSPVPDDNTPGGVGGVLATVQEITEKVVAERRLATLHELSLAALEVKTAEEAGARVMGALEKHSEDIPFALLYLVEADQSFARLAGATGIKEGHELGPSVVDLRPGSDRGEAWPLAAAARNGRLKTVTGIRSHFAKGDLPQPWSDPPHQAVIVPIRAGTTGLAAGFLVAGVSARLRLDLPYRTFFEVAAAQIDTALTNARTYAEERQRAEALAQLDRAKTQFFNTVSHEFRTPLTLMMGPLEDLLASGVVVGDDATFQLETSYRNSLRLLKLVNTLLEFSRIEAGRIDAVYEATDLAELTRDLASTFRAAIERAGLTLVVDCPTLPQDVYVDREMWEKIVLNLLSNALKFTFDGQIEVRLASKGASVELMVRDSGTGIDPEHLPRVFERFYRIRDARARTFEGSGIGLALVQELVRLHGGEIVAESSYGSGSAFYVRIPLGSSHLPRERVNAPRALASTAIGPSPFVQEALRWTADDQASGPPTDRGDPPATEQGRASTRHSEVPTVLVADDNADMLEYVSRILSPRWNVVTARDGAAALAIALEQHVDIVLSDVMMPRLDGLQLLAALRSTDATAALPVILISARAGEESRIEGLMTGADDYLVKPFSARELTARVSTHLALAEARDSARHAAERERRQVYSIFMESPYPIAVLCGPDLTCEMANPAATRLFGGDRTGSPLLEASPALPPGLADALRQAALTRQTITLPELETRAESGGDRAWWTFTITPLSTADGPAGRILVLASPVTVEVLARQEAEADAQRAHAAAEAREEFVSLVSHELRTPMTTILGNAQFLHRGGDAVTEPARSQALTDLITGAGRLQSIVEALLWLTRLEASTELEHEFVAIRPLLNERITWFTHHNPGRSVHLIEDGSRPVVLGQSTLLAITIDNLLSNADKYSLPGSEIEVHLGATDTGDVEVSVRDYGIGVEPKEFGRVFTPFYRTDAARSTAPGAGLGLAVCARIIAAHRGRIWLSSPPGGGIRFSISLPIAPPV